MVSGHVPEQPDGKGQWSHQMTDQFDWKHQRGKQGHWAEKLFDVTPPVLTDSEKVGSEKNDQGKCDGHVELVGWRIESRHQS